MPEPRTPPPEPHDFPVVLDVSGWPCLVVGGGPVAARRAGALLAAGAVVTVVAPSVTGAVDDLAAAGPALTVERRPYRSGEATEYRLVATATGRPDVDASVVADATGAGVIVTSAARATPGTARLPAVHRSGPVTLAVSTTGTSPALAGWLRDRLAACLPPGLPTIAALVEEARTARQRSGHPTETLDWTGLLEDHVAPLVAAGRVDEAREILRAAGPPPEE